MKKLFCLLLALILMLMLTACGCEHEFAAADCVNPPTCTLCGETEGTPLGHVWMAATCDTPKTCEVCGTAEGEAKGHSMVEATCEEAKHCESCNLTEGEALGHSWLEATTELPQTCEVCAVTEGERIITDPRFTTAATKELQGKWMMQMMMSGEEMGMPDFEGEAPINVIMIFGNSGEMTVTCEVTQEFVDSMILSTENSFYAELAAEGYSKEEADEGFESIYGMSIHDYVTSELSVENLNEVFGALFESLGGVYYVDGAELYFGYSWDEEMDPSAFTLECDTLFIEEFFEVMELDEEDEKLIRVVEE